jgi:ubiquinone/menaquinone biosynthesis C-methylase UbiE
MAEAIRKRRAPWGSFDDAEAYDRFMGRFSVQLAPQLADFAGVTTGQRVLDVGCGPGALTGELVRRVGPESVSAIDPSERFVDAARLRHPGVSVQRSVAEALPFPDGMFDVALAQLVVQFLEDPLGGLAEMARVTREGGVIAICEWSALRPNAHGPIRTAPRRRPRPLEIGPANRLRALRIEDVAETELTASVRYERFEDWWTPIVEGVGPTATYYRTLDDEKRAELREQCLAELSPGPFVVEAFSPAARGTVRRSGTVQMWEPSEIA